MLHDLRIVDLSIVTAGGGSTAVLGDFDADIIKVEGPNRPDPFRTDGVRAQNPSITDEGPHSGVSVQGAFTTVGRNKRSIAVDLKQPDGVEIVRRLVQVSDVVVENFRRGVLERLGLGFAELIKRQPRIVLATIASQGASGPNLGHRSYGSVLDALGGTASITGYDVDTPRWSTNKVNYPDQLVSMFAPGLILAGVLTARATGTPQLVDISQREMVTSAVGEWLLAESITGVDPVPSGNQGPCGIEWVSPCRGDDEWLAISVLNAASWHGLCAAIRRHDLAGVDIFAESTEADRMAEEVKEAVRAWTATRDKIEAMHVLQAAGVAAAAVRKAYELHDDAYLAAIHFWQGRSVPEDTAYRQRGFLARFADESVAGRVRRPAPAVGEHTAEVLANILGYHADDIGRLIDRGVIAAPSHGPERNTGEDSVIA